MAMKVLFRFKGVYSISEYTSRFIHFTNIMILRRYTFLSNFFIFLKTILGIIFLRLICVVKANSTEGDNNSSKKSDILFINPSKEGKGPLL